MNREVKPSVVVAVNGAILGVFTVVGMLNSLLLLVTLSIILAAFGLIFMRRTTSRDKEYVNTALKTTLVCAIVYVGTGIYASGAEESGITALALILLGFVVVPAYISISYMMAVLLLGRN